MSQALQSPEAIEQTLLALAQKRFGAKAVKLAPNDDFFEMLGINSLEAMDLLSDLEEAFGVEIPDYELQGVNSIAALAQAVKSKL